ncbi:MAG: Wzz/FepE/Etk N-terminal domain-containing protein [Elusimicrobiota bacterium]
MQEQEIDLRDYVNVIVKRWKLLVGLTVGCAVVSAVISLLLPPVYETTAIIEPAKIQKTPIETAEILEVLFKNPLNPYLRELLQQLGIKDGQKAYKIRKQFSIKDKVGYLLVSGKDRSPEKAKKLVDEIVSLILKRQDEIIKSALSIVDDEMNKLKEQIGSTKNEIEQLDKKFVQKEKAETMGQGLVFQSLISAKENALKRQSELEEKLRQKEMELKYSTKPATVVAESTIPKIKIAPQRSKIVLLSTIVGFMFSVFYVFIVEYFEKGKL